MTLVSLVVLGACERDEPVAVDRNRPPETFVTLGPDISEDPDDPVDLFYRAHLFWRGEDVDGTIVGFRYAIDDTSELGAWSFTTRTDSVFRFPVAEIGSKEHLFLIRAVDDLGKQDPSPDTLRFESFTSANPTVRYLPEKFELSNGAYGFEFDFGQDRWTHLCDPGGDGTGQTGVFAGDTVKVCSEIKFVWTGDDADGEVVGWESKFDTEPEWRFHARNDTTRTERNLTPGPHTLSVQAIDDAGAKSTAPSRFFFTCDFDPVTEIDRNSIRAFLPPQDPWLPETLWVDYLDGATVQDTMPLGSFIEMSWRSTDVDGPVVRYQWQIGEFQGQTPNLPQDPGIPPATSADTSISVGPFVNSTRDGEAGMTLRVKGIDFFNNVEGRPDTLRLHVNYPPEVHFVCGTPPVDFECGDPAFECTAPETVFSGSVFTFPFCGDDRDGNPDSLTYRWQFSFQPTAQPDSIFSPDALWIPQEFDSTMINAGEPEPHILWIEALDASGRARPSRRDTLEVWVLPATQAYRDGATVGSIRARDRSGAQRSDRKR